MVKQRRLKYFSVEGDVWCPTKDDFLSVDVTKKDLPKIQDAYGKFVGFPTHDNFIRFIQKFFKLKTFKSAETEFKNIKPIFIDNPFSKNPYEGLDLLLNSCLIYLSLLKPKEEPPLFIQQVLFDQFPFGNLSDLKSFLDSSFSSRFTLDQQVVILKWLQPILKSKDSVVLGPKKSFPSCSSSAKTIQKHEFVSKWLETLGSAKEKAITPFSGFSVKVTTTKTGKLVGIGTLILRFNSQESRVSVRLDHQAVLVIGLISHHELQNPQGYKRTKMSFDDIQYYSEQYGLIQSDGVPFADSFNKVKATINKKVIDAVKKEYPSKAKAVKNFLVSDNGLAWISTVSRPFLDRYDFLFQLQNIMPKRKRQKKIT